MWVRMHILIMMVAYGTASSAIIVVIVVSFKSLTAVVALVRMTEAA